MVSAGRVRQDALAAEDAARSVKDVDDVDLALLRRQELVREVVRVAQCVWQVSLRSDDARTVDQALDEIEHLDRRQVHREQLSDALKVFDVFLLSNASVQYRVGSARTSWVFASAFGVTACTDVPH